MEGETIVGVHSTQELRTAERAELHELPRQEGRALPVVITLVAANRQLVRCGERPAQHRSVIKVLAQHLEDRAGDGVTLKNLPEARRPPPVHKVVTVMIGPNAILGRLENSASQNPEAESHQHIKVVRPYRLDVVVMEPVEMIDLPGPHVHDGYIA